MEAPKIIFTISWQYTGRTVCENKHHYILNGFTAYKSWSFYLKTLNWTSGKTDRNFIWYNCGLSDMVWWQPGYPYGINLNCFIYKCNLLYVPEYKIDFFSCCIIWKICGHLIIMYKVKHILYGYFPENRFWKG